MIGLPLWGGRVRRLLDLLDEERALILAGDLPRLAALAPRCQAALDEVVGARPPDRARVGADLDRIRSAAQRNRRLLAAFMAGAADAARELERQVEAGRRLGYDRNGAVLGVEGGKGPGRRA